MKTAHFNFSFNKEALRARGVNKVAITREQDEPKNIVNHKSGALSVQDAMDVRGARLTSGWAETSY